MVKRQNEGNQIISLCYFCAHKDTRKRKPNVSVCACMRPTGGRGQEANYSPVVRGQPGGSKVI